MGQKRKDVHETEQLQKYIYNPDMMYRTSSIKWYFCCMHTGQEQPAKSFFHDVVRIEADSLAMNKSRWDENWKREPNNVTLNLAFVSELQPMHSN